MHRKMWISGFLEDLMGLFGHFKILLLYSNPSFPLGFMVFFFPYPVLFLNSILFSYHGSPFPVESSSTFISNGSH